MSNLRAMVGLRRVLGGVVLGAIALGAPLPAMGSTQPGSARPGIAAKPRLIEPDGEPRDCLEATPATYGVPDAASDTPVVLDLLILADGITEQDARDVAELAARPYEKLGIELRATIREHYFDPDGTVEASGGTKETINGDTLMAAAKGLFPESKRPAGFDVVYAMTTKDLWKDDAASGDRDYSLAGRADCIGGVRYAERAFAVGEVDDSFSLILEFSPDYTAIVTAHEIGHLMGAHHHYAVCGTSAAQLAQLRGDVCTIMFPEASTPTLEFSPQNGVIVYGHAEDYAS